MLISVSTVPVADHAAVYVVAEPETTRLVTVDQPQDSERQRELTQVGSEPRPEPVPRARAGYPEVRPEPM